MDETMSIIRSNCPLYICCVCRTKTGWRHQVWCELKGFTMPGCGECRYRSARDFSCTHPVIRKGGAE